MQDSAHGSYVIGWDQVELDGRLGADVSQCRPGAGWRWSGRAVRLDGPADILRLPDAAHAEARRRARRLAGRFAPLPRLRDDDGPALAGAAITVSDGRRSWRVDLLRDRRGSGTLAHFAGSFPPPRADLWITGVERIETLVPKAGAGDETCTGLSAGALLPTVDGPVAAGQIVAGIDLVTVDGSLARVVRVDRRVLTGARLCVQPALVPVRLARGAADGRGDILIGPDQRILLEGPAVRAAYATGPVAAVARDTVDGRRIARAEGVAEVTLVSLELDRAAGIAVAGVTLDLGPEGEGAGRVLSPGETAILLAAQA